MDKKQKQLLENILSKNPQVDVQKVAEGHMLLERLRCLGRRRSYSIALPMSGRSARLLDDSIQDSRTVNLRT